MTTTTYEPAFSPSHVHHQLIDALTPELGYDGGDVTAWQARLRAKLLELLGLDRMPKERAPLNVRRLWKRDHALGTIEKLVFTCEPGSDTPAYLCLPREGQEPYPVFVCIQGHSGGMYNSIAMSPDDEQTVIEVEADRDFAIGCMKRGIAALCIEQRSFGERQERLQSAICAHNGCHDAAMRALLLGRTLAGERVYDVDRAIDLLEELDLPVDMNRLGLMGNSGGGTVTTFAAVLDRVRFAMPSCSFCTIQDSIGSIYHCPDNYVPHILRFAEMADILGLYAPRPVVVVNGQSDPIFPIEAAKREMERLRGIYRAAGAEQNVQHVIGPEGHQFYEDQAWATMLPLLGMEAQ